MGEIPWRNISIADLLTILHDAFDISFGSLAMKIIASYNSLYKKGFPGHQPDDQTVRRWAREECIPVEKKISTGVLETLLFKCSPNTSRHEDIIFIRTLLDSLEKYGYNVYELRMYGESNREDVFKQIAREARSTSDQRKKDRRKKIDDAREAGIPPTQPKQSGSLVVEEGTMIKAPHPCFPHRKDHSSDLFVKFYHDIATPYGRYSVPYKELFGHAAPGIKEYIEGKNISFNYEDFTVDYASRVTTCDFQKEVQKKKDAAATIGYTSHPPKLCLVDYLETRSEDLNGGETKYDLSLTFGTSHYLENLVWRDELQRNKKEQEIFRTVLASSSKEHLQGFDHGPWAAAGGGCWVITSDNFLVMSYRSPTRVGEVAGRLGYSSSGSYGRYTVDSCGMPIDNTPGNAMVKELSEELGLPEVKPEELVQISLGLDLERGLAQWSYLLQSKYAADDIAYFRQDWATTADEQTVFFVPLETPDICYRLLSECEFEPGSAFSLYRLLTKRFGPPRYEKN